jgi:hypothetical protein
MKHFTPLLALALWASGLAAAPIGAYPDGYVRPAVTIIDRLDLDHSIAKRDSMDEGVDQINKDAAAFTRPYLYVSLLSRNQLERCPGRGTMYEPQPTATATPSQAAPTQGTQAVSSDECV